MLCTPSSVIAGAELEHTSSNDSPKDVIVVFSIKFMALTFRSGNEMRMFNSSQAGKIYASLNSPSQASIM